MTEKSSVKVKPEVATAEALGNQPTIHWDESEMQSVYANVCNVMGTREEISLVFGSNQTLQPKPGGEVNIKVSNRVMLTPHAAKRFALLLKMGLDQYEQKFGEIKL